MVSRLTKRRLGLCSHIAHYRKMVECGYHKDFFWKLIRDALKEQGLLLKEERAKLEGEK